ncbi:MAG TPA: DUF4159 domain-containing protein [Steroidobacteraceae bacterium]|nr:DUF4159 domain-containing protein [Steroidobacteraceae bacterium]
MRSILMAGLLFTAVLVAASEPRPTPGPSTSAEFQFARMIYVDYPGAGRFGRGWWQQDWPEAEEHFVPNLGRMTRVHAGESVVLRLTDERLFEYPWLYATQTGYWDLSDEEVERLREYLLRGGFLMCDDFWNEDEMFVFQETMARVFPELEMVELKDGDAVLHVVFDIDEAVQVPGLRHLRGGGQVQQLPPPQWFGIYDEHGRLMVGINYNQDVGDGWEHANWVEYPQPMTAQSYRFGINYVIYAMTH